MNDPRLDAPPEAGATRARRVFVRTYYRHRGWILALPFLALLFLRATADSPLRWSVLPLIGAAMLLRAWAGRHLGPHGNGVEMETPSPARTGPYAFSRHPLYLANMVTGVTLVLFGNLPAPQALPLIVFVLGHHALLARVEENALRRSRPEEYEDYAARTPRWFGLKPPEGAAAEEKAPDRLAGDRDENAPPRTPQTRNLLYATAAVLLIWGAERVSRGG